MAERYRRYAKSIPAATLTTVYTAPNDGADPVAAAESVIIGFLIASTSTSAGEVTVELIDHYDDTSKSLVNTIPLPADSSVDIIPGKLVLQHGLNDEGTPALTGDILKITSTQTCDVIISVVERV